MNFRSGEAQSQRCRPQALADLSILPAPPPQQRRTRATWMIACFAFSADMVSTMMCKCYAFVKFDPCPLQKFHAILRFMLRSGGVVLINGGVI